MSTMLVPSTPERARLADPAVYRMTVYEYERLTTELDDPRVELIDGYLVKKMGIKPPHFWAVDSTEEELRTIVPRGWCLRGKARCGFRNSTSPSRTWRSSRAHVTTIGSVTPSPKMCA